ncbi:hypothetical protein HF521_021017 [Silurus meridionalis]|uniref:Uncharacterized protein n=1 Tax=Silurus meridionalis TaxID=175797 RepID=A0A8T0BF10_SILME|nr:hypothetical protein HF521_021017 [Silurus meridionalis]
MLDQMEIKDETVDQMKIKDDTVYQMKIKDEMDQMELLTRLVQWVEPSERRHETPLSNKSEHKLQVHLISFP